VTEIAELRTSLRSTQARLAKAKAKNDELATVTIEACREAVLAYGPLSEVPKPAPDRRKAKEEHALGHSTDWQGAKKTTTYNSQVMRERVLRYCDKVDRIVAMQRADHPVKHATLMFGGDMVEGLFNFPTQPFEIDATIFEQYVNVSMLMVEMVRRWLATFETVTVVAEWGNHGRIGSKRDNVPRHDNFDRMCYELARQILKDESRLTWEDCPEDVQKVEIGNYRAILLHGDEIGRNGFSSPATIVSHVTRWQSGSFGWDFNDAYIAHYHQHQEWSLPNGHGSVYMTGSTESDNRYAGVMLAASATPSQRLHFIEPEAGRVTSQHKIWLDK
jgi:hypothetical protein